MTAAPDGLLEALLLRFGEDLLVILFVSAAAFLRALFRTVESGQRGLRFTLGRPGAVLEPGLHFFLPIVQSLRVVPARSRTMDLPAQKIVTKEGLVFLADANIVFRIVDLRKALVEVDDLLKAMGQILGLSVQEVLRSADSAGIRDADTLGRALHQALDSRLAAWGVKIERAGFPSIAPEQKSLRVTQLRETMKAKKRALPALLCATRTTNPALSLLGLRQVPISRARHIRQRETEQRRKRRIKALLKRAGWKGSAIRRAEGHLAPRP